MFYIKRLTIVTGNGVLSNLDFDAGLNIIHGESNTGKSLIVDCIDYMFGANEHRFDQKSLVQHLNILYHHYHHNK